MSDSYLLSVALLKSTVSDPRTLPIVSLAPQILLGSAHNYQLSHTSTETHSGEGGPVPKPWDAFHNLCKQGQIRHSARRMPFRETDRSPSHTEQTVSRWQPSTLRLAQFLPKKWRGQDHTHLHIYKDVKMCRIFRARIFHNLLFGLSSLGCPSEPLVCYWTNRDHP